MLHLALVFLVVGLMSAVLGFTTIAGLSFFIAKFLTGLFLALFVAFLCLGLAAAKQGSAPIVPNPDAGKSRHQGLGLHGR